MVAMSYIIAKALRCRKQRAIGSRLGSAIQNSSSSGGPLQFLVWHGSTGQLVEWAEWGREWEGEEMCWGRHVLPRATYASMQASSPPDMSSSSP